MAEEETILSVKELRRYFSQKGNAHRPQHFRKQSTPALCTGGKAESGTKSKLKNEPRFLRSHSAGDLRCQLSSVPIPLHMPHTEVQATKDPSPVLGHLKNSHSIASIKQILESKQHSLFGFGPYPCKSEANHGSNNAGKSPFPPNQRALDNNWTLSSERTISTVSMRRNLLQEEPAPSAEEPIRTTIANRFKVTRAEEEGKPPPEAGIKSPTINLTIKSVPPPAPQIHRSEVKVFVNGTSPSKIDVSQPSLDQEPSQKSGGRNSTSSNSSGEECLPRLIKFTNNTSSGEVIKPSYPLRDCNFGTSVDGPEEKSRKDLCDLATDDSNKSSPPSCGGSTVNIIIKNPVDLPEKTREKRTNMPPPAASKAPPGGVVSHNKLCRATPVRTHPQPFQFHRHGDSLLLIDNQNYTCKKSSFFRRRAMPPGPPGPPPPKPERPSCVVATLERLLKSLPSAFKKNNPAGGFVVVESSKSMPAERATKWQFQHNPTDRGGLDMLREIERELMLRRQSSSEGICYMSEGSGASSEYDDVLASSGGLSYTNAPSTGRRSLPQSIGSSICTPPSGSEEIYQDVFECLDDQNIYETVPLEDPPSFSSTFYINTSNVASEGSLKKAKHKERKELERLKKKFGLTGEEVPLDVGFVKQDQKRRGSDLSVHKGEVLYILRMEGNPVGKWLVKNLHGKVGFVDLSNIAVDAKSVKSVMLNGKFSPFSAINPHCSALDGSFPDEGIYEVTY